LIHEGHEETRRRDLTAKSAKSNKEKRLTAKDAKEREGKTRKVILSVVAVSIVEAEGRLPVWSGCWTPASTREGQAVVVPARGRPWL
jgi:hypothetical protein